jgi:hypothetical protein
LLAEEISSRLDNLCIIIRILEEAQSGPDTEMKEIGDAIVELLVMIEDSCGIVRQVSHSPHSTRLTLPPQEIDICDLESGDCIGSAVVDVRGHHLLARCS